MKTLTLILFQTLFLSLFSFGIYAQTKNEYLFLKGTMGSAQMSMHLYKKDNRYSGYYYQEKFQRPIEIDGFDSSRTGKLKMFASYKGNREIFIIERLDRRFNGFMEIEGSGKQIPVRLAIANSPLKMAFVVHEDSVKLLDQADAYPVCKVSVQTPWPDIKTTDFDFLKDDIREVVTGVTYHKEEIVPLLKMLTDREMRKYKLDYLNVSEQELKASYRSFSVDMEKNLRIIYHTHRLVSFAYKEYNYSGGAHGNTSYQFFTVDKESKKQLTLNSLFNRSAVEDLLPLLEKWYLYDKGVKEGTSLTEAGLFENKISKTPTSCYVTDKGMGFVYNPYIIAPYSSGVIHIFVPYSDLLPLISKAFAKSMNWM